MTTINAEAEIYCTLRHSTSDFYHVQLASSRYAYWDQLTVKHDGTRKKCFGIGANIKRRSIIGSTVVVPKELSATSSVHLPPVQISIPTNCGAMPHLGGIQYPLIQSIDSRTEAYTGNNFQGRSHLREVWKYEYLDDTISAQWYYVWDFYSGLE